MPSIQGSETEKNLLKTFAGESQARNRYSSFSSIARKEGLVQIADIFSETADQEKEHAKRMFKFLEGGMLEITAMYPAGVLADTAANLTAAAAGEHEEWETLYPAFSEVARAEGFTAVAVMYKMISIAEKQHEKRYLGLLKALRAGLTFSRPEPVTWRCRNCCFIHTSKTAPKTCPACDHPQAHFEILAENW